MNLLSSMEKSLEMFRRQYLEQYASDWHNVNQITPTTFRHNVWSIRCKLSQHRQKRTPNTYNPIYQNLWRIPKIVDPIKGCAEVKLRNRSILNTLQWILQCMGHTQKYMTSIQTFPISKLGGFNHTTAVLESSETNRYQVLEHLRQRWCYGNRLELRLSI